MIKGIGTYVWGLIVGRTARRSFAWNPAAALLLQPPPSAAAGPPPPVVYSRSRQ
jgi:hypothetical protein